MPFLSEVLRLATRAVTEGSDGEVGPAAVVAEGCDSSIDYDGRVGLRISSIFVILVGSTFGAVFPVWASRHHRKAIPGWVWFIAKYFGSGVIVATAFIHLLAPANDALRDPCLTGPITEYPWVEGIALMTVFMLFFVELMAMRYAHFTEPADRPVPSGRRDLEGIDTLPKPDLEATSYETPRSSRPRSSSHQPGDDHLGHVRTHADMNSYAAQMTAVFILEFGVVFHSIFIGLTLAVAGEEFNTLYVVLVFHQTFEGLGLGSRLAMVGWPAGRRWTPYLLGIIYGLATPISIAIGLGIRAQIGNRTGLIVNGVFDSISAGILLYTGLVELMAHEFMFNEYMRQASIKVVLAAFGIMSLGAGLMALLGKWA
ncbi:MAG: hypothetical protein M1816_004737 [Peltula sp. TS41687]|nr:MAG: hypothetical protein M1816_004737 [Peltula sp. TS41687]